MTQPLSLHLLLSQALGNEVSEKEITSLTYRTRLLNSLAKQVIFREGDLIQGIYILVSGSTKTLKLNNEYKHVCIQLSHSQRFFGTEFISGLKQHPCSLEAKVDCSLLLVKVRRKDLHFYPEFHNKIMDALIDKNRRVEEILTQLLTKSISQQVAAKLVAIADPETDRAFVTQTEMAEMLGVSRQKVHYQIKKMASEGIITSGYRWFEIKKKELLLKKM